MKILLVQPPIEDFYSTGIRTYPLALLYLAAKLRNICEVSVADLRTVKKPIKSDSNSFPELQDYYRHDVYTPLSFLGRYYRFGYSREKIRTTIASQNPDVVCISSLFTTYAIEAIEVAKICKQFNESIITVMGGTHATVFPTHLLSSPYVDYVIRGEGETPLFELISALKIKKNTAPKDIKGICFKDGGKLFLSDIHTESNIDLIPDRSLIDSSRYRIGKKNYTFFLTSRGCPFHCSFCGRPPVPYRKRSIESIEREIAECIKLNIQSIDFEDDMLTFDTCHFNEMLNLLKGKGLTLSAMNGIYSETLNSSILENMLEAGFVRLNFSLVDINRHVISDGQRFYSTTLLKLLPFLESSPFLIETHFIIGLPGQKPLDIIDMLIFLMGKRLLLGPSIFYLAPNTHLFENFFKNDWERHIKSLRSSFMFPVNPLFQRDTVFTLMKLTRFINLIKYMLDSSIGIERLSNLPDMFSGEKASIDKEILTELIHNKRLICYDKNQSTFFEEKQDKQILNAFFRKTKGSIIKGFKTANFVVCDV